MRFLTVLLLSFVLSFAAFAQSDKQTKPLAGNFTATSLDGKTFDLAELRGKVVLLTFWSTKCVICHNEMPKLNQLAQSYKDKNVVFLGLTMENSNKVEPYLKKTTFNFIIIPNSFGVVLQYADKDNEGRISMGFPAHFLINQKGEIELKTNGFDKTATLESRISKLLSEQ